MTASELRNTAADMFVQHSDRRGAILTRMGYSALAATRFNYLERFSLQTNKTPRRRGLTNRATKQWLVHRSAKQSSNQSSASPQRGRSEVSGARCAERASEAGARGRINKVAGV